MGEPTLAEGLKLTRTERVEAWLLTGPAGRVWAFARDMGSAVPLMAAYGRGRLRHKLRR